MEQSKTRDTTACASQFAQTAPLIGSCFWCERSHPAEHPLSVCPACAVRYSTLRLLEMNGSFPLSDEAIDAELMSTSPGNYALGYMDGGVFDVLYVGRSDSDLRQCLHDWVGMPSRSEKYASSARASWGVKCRQTFPIANPTPGRVGNAETSYTRFAYSCALSSDEACAKEWRNYDAFGGRYGLDNETEPVSAAT